MTVLLIMLVALPLLVSLGSIVLPEGLVVVSTVAIGVVSFGAAIALAPRLGTGAVIGVGFLRADALSLVFVLATTFLYATTAVYSVGYLSAEGRTAAPGEARFGYRRRFWIGLNVFAWSMICAPLVNGLALLWIAIEITTVASALLVALDNTDGAAEAAWKYVLIASSGLGIALLATIFMYYSGTQALGTSFDLAFVPLLQVAHQLPAVPVELAFGLAVVGYGTKVGLFPVHTWLPDAHAEAPTPVSALLSGALLATSFYAILRFYQIAVAALGPRFPQRMLLIFGVLSLLLAALYLFDQHNIKRMLAYSSIEHMGILAIGVSFGASLAFLGVLLHVLAHAAGKGAAFMGAGSLVEKYRTKEVHRIRGGLVALPWTGPLFGLAVFGLCALPPFGIFRSEFWIISGGLGSGHAAAGTILVALATLAFAGLVIAVTKMLLEPAPAGTAPVSTGELSVTMVLAPCLAVAVLALLGLHPPASLIALLRTGAGQLLGGAG